MVKLQTKVPAQLDAVIRRLQIAKDIKRGKATRFLLELALANPNFQVAAFGEGDVANCTLEVAEAFYASTIEYRDLHKLTAKSAFFRDALFRGASVYIS